MKNKMKTFALLTAISVAFSIQARPATVKSTNAHGNSEKAVPGEKTVGGIARSFLQTFNVWYNSNVKR